MSKKIEELVEIHERLKKRAENLEFNGLMTEQAPLDLDRFNELLVLFWHSFLAFFVPLLVAETPLDASPYQRIPVMIKV